MPFDPADISTVPGTTYYVNEEPTPAELELFTLPVNFKILVGSNKYKIVSYKANGQRLELESSDKNWEHDQFTPASIWVIEHPLNKKVSVEITDSAGTTVEGKIVINNGSQVTVEFNFPFSGTAVLN